MRDGGTLSPRRVVVLTPWGYLGYIGLSFFGGALVAALVIGTFAGKVGL